MTGFFFSGAGHSLSTGFKHLPGLCCLPWLYNKALFPGIPAVLRSFLHGCKALALEAAPPGFQLPKKLETTFFRFTVNESCKL
ncbi:hypothetical protein [Heyndrickxia coagulans]|uniref:hypothetical protein n=1 Tax=Heyndrickxia coagulans TaxID=1398 RepID=UPI001451824C|nr:hypothetical protein [Heyndrickxia coagulans]MCR2846863.1 hypothetical protein [Heyndrickxia coagulans]MED4495262.1 hypothetical protein [Heyndrickxia coagulans]MED4536694.1 hypothetical protein [Heyndrickxia coagulans]QJE32024.1 hypothetical protein HHU11_04825 [Heyndrickxia coagulans]QQS91228.1 hypothetical protein I6J17_09240 [Heyndrickxia coagulans]